LQIYFFTTWFLLTKEILCKTLNQIILINGFELKFADSSGLFASSEITPVVVLVWENKLADRNNRKIK
jgi:hypothetical protein